MDSDADTIETYELRVAVVCAGWTRNRWRARVPIVASRSVRESRDVNLETTGEGPDVVLLHGLPQAPRHLGGLRDALSKAYRTTIVHLPGYGGSPGWPEPVYDLSEVGDAIARALMAAQIASPVLVGVSGGSYRSFQLALDHPELSVRATAHLGPCADLPQADREAFPELGKALVRGDDLVDVAVGRFFAPDFAGAHLERCRKIASEMIAAVHPQDLAKEMRGFAKTVSLMPRLHELESPTYLRVGELDVPTPAAHSRGIAQRIPNSRLDVCAGRGHLLQVEEPTHTAEALLRFLAAID